MVWKRIKTLFKREKKNTQLAPVVPENHHVVRLWVKGIEYESRAENITQCRMKEKVLLLREPNNVHDKNAIHIKMTDGKSLGYVDKKHNIRIAKLIDEGKIEPVAYITKSQSSLNNRINNLQVSFSVSSGIFEELLEPEDFLNLLEIEYLIEESENAKVYLLLNCSGETCLQVEDFLRENDIAVLKQGKSGRKAKNGKIYEWYIQIESPVNEMRINKLLNSKFSVSDIQKEKEEARAAFELMDLAEEKGKELLSEINNLEEQLNQSKKEIESLKNNITRLEKNEFQFEELLNNLFPNTLFLRDSIEIFKGNPNKVNLLTELWKITNNPTFRGEPVRSKKNWYEAYYTSGKKGKDGRIYFCRKGTEIKVLISFKKHQKKDILSLDDNP